MKPLNVVVDCDRWCRGGMGQASKYGQTCLLNEKGYRCCLGFVAKRLGYEDEALFSWGMPENACTHPVEQGNVLCSFHSEPGVQHCTNSEFTNKAIRFNDDGFIDDGQRMRLLRDLGRQHGVEFKFTHVPKRQQ